MRNAPDAALAWIGLSSIPGVGRATFRKLLACFGSPERALAASPAELKGVGGLSPKTADAIGSFPWRKPAEREVARAAAAGVAIVTLDDPAYPAPLRATPDPPVFLYVRGALLPEDANAVAVVGTRRPSRYGTTTAFALAQGLAAASLTVVSGMARGIDTEAHRGALAAGGRTVAVLGCGIDVVYPKENAALMRAICGSGAVITENPFGTRPEAGYFPARNRIISGLARGTVIIEAANDSGSLITADYARDQERTLFAVPGNVGLATSRGTNSLIKRGALLVESTADVLAGLGIGGYVPAPQPGRPLPVLDPDEAAVLERLGAEPKHIDVLGSESGLAAGSLGGVLMTLELKGLAKQLPGKYFVRDL